jgi:hypothetical protein
MAIPKPRTDKFPRLIAYRLSDSAPMQLVPAPISRSWMDATLERYAYRCLPLLIANQAGWFVLNSHELRATWNGDEGLSGVEIEYLSGTAPYPASSHFGHGILTWTLPYLFRTPPGHNLLARGPPNWPKDGAYALEGIVETDWAVATFTMNWKLTQPGTPVTFALHEPICMVVPQRRGELEEYRPEICTLDEGSELGRQFRQWSDSRGQFILDLEKSGSLAQQRGWEKDYFRGRLPGGASASEHQLKLSLEGFAERSDQEVNSK